MNNIKEYPIHLCDILSDKSNYQPLNISPSGVHYPLGFNSYESFIEKAQQLIDTISEFDNKAIISIYGSSIQGFKFKRKENSGLWFDESSDYDIAICSEQLYRKFKKIFPIARSNNAKSTFLILYNIDNIIISQIYNSIQNWPRIVNLCIYKKLSDVIACSILSLNIITDENHKIINTNIVGEDIMNNKIIGLL
jgi:hypothetical protein